MQNEEKFIKKSINNILNQTYLNYELVIVDDNSADNTADIIRSFNDPRIRFFELAKPLGRTKSLNFGLKKSKGQFIAIQDGDDISIDTRLKSSMKIFEKNPDIELIGTKAELIDQNDKYLGEYASKYFLKFDQKKLKIINFLFNTSFIFKKKFFYDEEYIYAQDYKMLLQFLLKSKIFVIKEKLVKIRIHKNSMSHDVNLSKTRLLEKINLLDYVKTNFKNTIEEMIKINFIRLKYNFILVTRLFLRFRK